MTTEPRTEAGRALLSIGDEFRFARPEYAVREAVLAYSGQFESKGLVSRAAVLALFSTPTERTK